MKDVLDFKDVPGAVQILLHPVIQTFLEIKWSRIRRLYFLTFATYVVFLLTYSAYLANIFYRKDKYSVDRRIRIEELLDLVAGIFFNK